MRMRQAISAGWKPALVMAAGLAVSGCSTSETTDQRDLGGPSAVVTPSSFAGPRSSPVDTERPAALPGEAAAAAGSNKNQQGTFPVMALGGVPSAKSEVAPSVPPPPAASARPVVPAPVLTTTVDKPPVVDNKAGALGVNVLVESLVGQINGRPVFASEILEPLDGRLRRIGAESPNASAWRTEASAAIVRELQSRIEDELILAEAKRNLTPEQKQGLFQFLEQMQANLAATQKGSSIAADEALKEATGRGIRQEAQDRLDQELIRKELMDKVASRVVVSWTDIKNEYERSYDTYNPPSVAIFRMILIDPRKPENASKVGEALGAGKPFAEVAATDLNTFNAASGGKMERTIVLTQAEGEYLTNPDLNQVCRTLAIGQVVGPISFNQRVTDKNKSNPPPADPASMRTAWLFLERIDKPEGVSLYDAQLEIESKLRQQRQGEEVQRYMGQLRRRGNISKMEVMGQRLLDIATERYAPQFLDAPGPNAPQKKRK